MNVFIVEARYHGHVADRLMDGTTAALDQGGARFERFAVPSVLEVAAAVALAARDVGFDGYVALGCVLGTDEIADTIYREAMHAIAMLGIQGLCIGNGIIYAPDERAAHVLTDINDAGGDAARGALALVTLRQRLSLLK